MEQYQSLVQSPAFSGLFKYPFSPMAAHSPLTMSNLNELTKPSASATPTTTSSHIQNRPGAISPSFSTLISAFTHFENGNAPVSPANFELLSNTPRLSTSSLEKQAKIEDEDQLQQQDQQSSNKTAVVPSTILSEHTSSATTTPHETSSAVRLMTTMSPASYINFQRFMNTLPKTIEISDQTMRMLSAFDRYTCGILSIKNGPTENPWRTVLLPLSQQYPVMLHSISALTCFHVARGDSHLRSEGMKHMKLAIMDLVHGLSDKSIPLDVALATCLVLANGEAWDRHVSTGISHLKGARTMISQMLSNLAGTSTSGSLRFSPSPANSGGSGDSAIDDDLDTDHESHSMHRGGSMSRTSSFSSSVVSTNSRKRIPKELHFMFNAWLYFDVLARMTIADLRRKEKPCMILLN
ncbi:unnamed protein product [Ambrosiozyma monospora]|uniref:Unnamed protein product n=1 Tax=Ambrosiozyma monospora TaxID=43982 RepID=A0ACB5U1V2_AMBMO|nr:unnamed protein product [Ambrosiozyma monospora]